jgi:hypothetical protein
MSGLNGLWLGHARSTEYYGTVLIKMCIIVRLQLVSSLGGREASGQRIDWYDLINQVGFMKAFHQVEIIHLNGCCYILATYDATF